METLKREYGFDLPPHLRYFKWMANLLRGDLGRSFFYNRPVLELLAERLPLSLLVSFLSYLIVSLTLAAPGMILGETALSFLGLGLRPPVVSWGVLLQKAQNLRTVALPVAADPRRFRGGHSACLNFLGDGLCDAADPYK